MNEDQLTELVADDLDAQTKYPNERLGGRVIVIDEVIVIITQAASRFIAALHDG